MTRRKTALLSFALLATLPAVALLRPVPARAANAIPFSQSAASSSVAKLIQPEFTAGRLSTDHTTGDIVGTGNARFTHGNALLTADEIRYNTRTQLATARGHVEFTRGALRMLADQCVYKVVDGTFTITAPRLGQYPYYISGKEAIGTTGTSAKITLSDATLSYQEPGPFAPTLHAGALTYTQDPDPRIQTSDTRIGLGPLSLIKLPHLAHPVDRSILSYFTIKVGYSGNLGPFADVGARVPVADGVKVGGDAGFYWKRGLLIGPGATYDITTDSGQRITGSLDTGYIHDYGNRLDDIRDKPISADRGFVTWKHDQLITPDLHLFGQVNYWSDSDITRDFRPGQFYSVQQSDNFLELDYAQPSYVVSLFARAQFNAYYPVQQRLPEVRFDLLPSLIGLQGIYQKGQASFAALSSNDPEPLDAPFEPTITSNRLDAYYALYKPATYKDIASITPILGGRVTYYADATGGKSDYTRGLGEIGFDAEAHIAGTFDYKNEKWGIDGLRHLMTPRISYRYIPQADRGTPYIPPIDQQTFSTYLQPLGLGDLRNIDQISPTNTFRIGLDNTLQTRDKTYGSRDLVILNFAADVRLDNAIPQGEHALSALHSSLSLMPANWLRFDLYDSVIPQNFTLRELNTGLTIHDGQLWSATLSTHYLRDQINEYIAEGRYRLNEVYQVYARLHYDARENRFNERSFGVIQRLGHNLWTIRYGVTMYQGHTRESNFGFSIEVHLANF